MKTLKYVVLAIILFSFPTFSSGQTLGSLRLGLIEGDVQVRTEDTGEWVPASINMPLMDGDRIWVPEGGRTELQLRDGTFLRLDEKSGLEILTVEKDLAVSEYTLVLTAWPEGFSRPSGFMGVQYYDGSAIQQSIRGMLSPLGFLQFLVIYGDIFAFNGFTWYGLMWPHILAALAWMLYWMRATLLPWISPSRPISTLPGATGG
jgi:hypothetical protein